MTKNEKLRIKQTAKRYAGKEGYFQLISDGQYVIMTQHPSGEGLNHSYNTWFGAEVREVERVNEMGLITDVWTIKSYLTAFGFTVSDVVEFEAASTPQMRYGFLVHIGETGERGDEASELLKELGYGHSHQFQYENGAHLYVPCGETVEDAKDVLKEEVVCE